MTTPIAPTNRADRYMPILAFSLGAAHLVFGMTKVVAVPVMVEQFHAWGLPLWMMYFVGVAQVLGGAGLLIRNLRLPASFAMGLVMIGATVTVLVTRHESFNAAITIPLALLCFVVTGHRLVQFAREFVADEARRSRRPSQ